MPIPTPLNYDPADQMPYKLEEAMLEPNWVERAIAHMEYRDKVLESIEAQRDLWVCARQMCELSHAHREDEKRFQDYSSVTPIPLVWER